MIGGAFLTQMMTLTLIGAVAGCAERPEPKAPASARVGPRARPSLALIDSLGPRAATDPHARSVLLDVLEHDPDPDAGLQALTWLGQAGAPAVAPLIRATTSPVPRTQRRAARALGLMETQSGKAMLIVPALTRLLTSPYPDVAQMANGAIASVAPRTRDRDVRLYRAIRFDTAVDRTQAVADVSWLGAAAAPAFPLLVPLLADTSGFLRRLAGQSLAQGGAASWAPVVKALRTGPPAVRSQALLIQAQITAPRP